MIHPTQQPGYDVYPNPNLPKSLSEPSRIPDSEPTPARLHSPSIHQTPSLQLQLHLQVPTHRSKDHTDDIFNNKKNPLPPPTHTCNAQPKSFSKPAHVPPPSNPPFVFALQSDARDSKQCAQSPSPFKP
ncbi:uncharacterized protein BDV14DRAFT_144561 [Aspergillus stella-maris]|uniref:uncharacterized protein n=1 Tax=Aspergillus stella-maris TaxID=1810926 RepID=UPI003CCD70FF